MSEYIVKETGFPGKVITTKVGNLIRCKNCTNWDTSWNSDYGERYHYCIVIDFVTGEDFYCAYGKERKY